MSRSEEAIRKIQAQASGKIHWGASDQEVRDWLNEIHGISGDEARAIISNAENEKMTAVRKSAIQWILFSALGVAFVLIVILAQYFGGFVLLGVPAVICYLVGAASLVTLLRNVFRLVTGKTEGNVD